MPNGLVRLSSSLFKNAALSVDDGAQCTAADTAARNPGCGIASFRKSLVSDLKVKALARPEADNPAHYELEGIGKKEASEIQRRAEIEIPLPGYAVNPDRQTMRKS